VRRRFLENPFVVLGLAPEATRAEVEGAGQRLLAMLELGVGDAGTMATPFGAAPRTADDVRRALAELRDPDRRLEHELWARGAGVRAAPHAPRPAQDDGWPGARRRLGLG
jgi:hypothetical protein